MNLKLSTIDLDALSDLTKTAVMKHETATLRAWELPDGSAVVMTLSASEALLIEPVEADAAQPSRLHQPRSGFERSRNTVVQAIRKFLLQ
jgi:hypothetical protein